ncbi:UDP-glycosyltransferase UGT4-like isoform X1 [Bradysia coprophila]|uniref:UDP-glycosyltransferase UGT4-like isoform X1 n=1 Tax=Bradysia coprophila TaxID=38358 RepID=UPI00187D9E09|nr:UDP-glycosyltransferase UGT4-like isoform X1 [Bradysia coprophila]
MEPKTLLPAVLLLLINVIGNESYKILGIFHTCSKSHYIVGGALMKGLAEKGHDVTVITPFPHSEPIKNFHEVPVTGIEQLFEESLPENVLVDMGNRSTIETLNIILSAGLMMTNYTLNHEVFQKFLHTKDIHFDVVVMEVFLNEAFLGIGHYFNAPVIGFSAFGASKSTNNMVGTPTPMSYIPHIAFADLESFLQRVINVLGYIGEEIIMNWFYMPEQEKIYNAIFPDPKPKLEELQKNVSLVLLNNHFSLSFPRPYVPNMIEVGGLQINRTPKPLPSDLQTLMDEAIHGVIYFSLGSNIKSKHIPADQQIEILNVFRKLKQTVLWKWDGQVADKPDNVHVSDWYPQDDLLAHPNMKLFITHGGLLSLTEAIYHAVPVIGIPIFADQPLNVARAETLGYGKSIQLNDLNEKILSSAIVELLTNDKYARKMKSISEIYRDQPMTPLETAIYWTEYVARHRGAPHLRSAGLDLSFFAYHSLDVFATVLAAVYFTWRLIKFVFCRITANGLKKNDKNVVNKKKVR